MRRPLDFVAGALVAMAVGCVSTATHQPVPTASMPPAAAPARPAAPPVSAEALAMRERGDAAMAVRDVATARLYYERAADHGDALGALRLGMTFDPGFLWRTQLTRVVVADPDLAAHWYRAAKSLGETRADAMLDGLAKLAGPAPAEPAKPRHAEPVQPRKPAEVLRPAPAAPAHVASPPAAAHTENRKPEPHPEDRIAAPTPAPAPTFETEPLKQRAGEPDPMLVPLPARPFQRSMLRESRAVWGMTAPTAVFGAQIQTESAWHPNAHSPYAAGLAQFIPATAQAMAKQHPETLGSADPLNPQWAIRALVQYDRDLFLAVHEAPEPCDRWAFTLSAYNGGPGWIPRDRRLCDGHEGCDTAKWFGNVEKYTGRSASNARENREYPRRILKQYQPNYRSWGGFIKCGE